MADITPPTIAVSSNKTALKSGETALITFTLSKLAVDFTLSDIKFIGGTLSNFSGSGTVYSATFTPSENSTSQGSVSVENFKFSDAAGNANEDGADSDNRVSFFVDTVAPSISISAVKTYLGFNENPTVTFTLSEPSTNFDIASVYVSGGALSAFKGSGTTYSAVFTPSATTNLFLQVSGFGFTDMAGNSNSGIQKFTFTPYDPLTANVLWTRLLGTTGNDFVKSIVTGIDGSIYITGFSNPLLYGTTIGGRSDGFFTKYNPDGTRVWTRSLGSTENSTSTAYALTTGQDGAIYVSSDTSDLQTVKASITKYGSDGTKVWTSIVSTITSDYVSALTTSRDNSIYVSGTTSGNLDGQTNSGGTDSFVSKYTSDGSKVWTRIVGTSGYDYASALINGQDGSIYLAGYTDGPLDGQSNNGGKDAFVTKLSADGTKVWTRLIGSNGDDVADSLALGLDGSIYVCGSSVGSFDGETNNGFKDAFVTKFSADGNKVWTRLLGSSNSDDFGSSIAIGLDGAIYVSGTTYGSIDQQISLGNSDAFVTRYNPDGTKVWTRVFGTSEYDFGSSEMLGRGALTKGPDGSIYIGGWTGGALDSQTNSGNFDAFIMKLTVADRLTPTIEIRSNKTSILIGDTVDLSFILSKPSTNFVLSDIAVQGGILSNFQGSSISYTANFTVGIEGATGASVSVGNGKFSDVFGVFNEDGADANNKVSFVVNTANDTTAPTIAVTSSTVVLSASKTATVTFTLNEASTTFVASDVTVYGGTLSNFSGNGTSYTALFTPTANSTTNGVISVASGVFTDAAGNANADGLDTNNTITLAIDTVVPTIALSASKTSLISGDTTTLTFTLSEASTTFAASDITVTGGTLSNFSGNGISYTALFTSIANGTTSGSVSVASGVFTDAAGNANADGIDANNKILFDVSGNKVWTRLLGSSGDDDGYSLTTGLDGSIYISGYTTGSLDGQANSGGEDGFVTKYSPDGVKVWTRLIGSKGDDRVWSLTTGLDGSIYLSGETTGSLDGQANNGGTDGFVAKYSPEGVKLWTRQIGSSKDDYSADLTTGLDGFIYVSGGTAGSLDGKINSGGLDAFLTKYNPDGSKVWTQWLETSGDDIAGSITTGIDGSVYLAGQTRVITDGKTSFDDYDAFVTKYSSKGVNLWTQSIATDRGDQAWAITTGLDGAIYVSGFTYGALDGRSNSGYGDGFVTKYSPNGVKVWTQLLGTSNYDEATALTTGLDGSIYVSGYTFGSLDGQVKSGSIDGFVTKFNSDGTKVWTRLIGNSWDTEAYGLTTGLDGSIYVSGFTTGSLDGQVNKGGIDAFLIKFKELDAIPTFSISVSNSLINEGSSAVFTLTTTNLALGTSVPYTLSGVSAADISGGLLSGNAVINSSGVATISVSVLNDSLTEGSETLTVTAGGVTASTLINDTSKSAATYSLNASSPSINEGSSVTFTLSTANLDSGTPVPYTLSGINSADISGGLLSGNAVINVSGVATVFITLLNDLLTESQETLTITAGGATASTVINDTSKSAATYSLNASSPSINEGSSATFTLSTANLESGTSVPYTLSGINSADISGGVLSGNAVINSSGVATISVSVLNDSLTEGSETLTVTAGGVTASTVINDTSKSVVTTWINAGRTSANEGELVSFVLLTIGIPADTSVPYTISGISSADIAGGKLTGNAVINSGGVATISVTLLNDSLTEGSETLTIGAGGASASIEVMDTSTSKKTALENHNLSVVVDKGVLGVTATLLQNLVETIVFVNGVMTKHTIQYAGNTFDYDSIDHLITTVTRDGEFTAEFTKEINDYVGNELNISYSSALKLVGVLSIDAVMLSVAGDDGKFVE